MAGQCDDGYQPAGCDSIYSCKCTCEPIDEDSECGHLEEKCCSGNTCVEGVCLNYGGSYGSRCVSDPKPPLSTPSSGESNIMCEETGIRTAIGCIHVLGNQNTFLSELLKWAVGIGGGIAFALMLYAGFMIMTASGNPERIKAGQELLTSAIAGLILLVLSIVILKFIGVDILGLDKFGFNQ